jgi:hypothetical protein
LPPLHQWLQAHLGRIRLNQQAFVAADHLRRPDHAHTLLTAIDCGAWWYTRDQFGRCHTNLTNLNRVLRTFLTVDGKHLISLDISCSQPIMLGLKMIGVRLDAARRVFQFPSHIGGAADPRVSRSACSDMRVSRVSSNSRVRRRVQQRLQNSPGGTPTPLTMSQFDSTQHAAKQRFLDDATRGKLYGRIANHIGRTRDEVKPWVLRAIYYDPKKWRNRSIATDCPMLADVIDAYQKLYPGVLEYTLKARERDHRKLPRDIQRDESYVVFNMICNVIRIQRPEVFAATIHDALLCKPEDAAFVRKIMGEQFRTLGVQPRIKEKSA